MGRIRRTNIPDRLGRVTHCGKILSTYTPPKMYPVIGLWNDALGRQERVQLHRMILLAFLGPLPENKDVCNHKNGDKQDARLENLEYVTWSENTRHAHDVLGFQPPRGKDHWYTKLTDGDIRKIRKMRTSGMAYRAIGDRFGVTYEVIGHIIRGHTWSHVK